MTENRYQ